MTANEVMYQEIIHYSLFIMCGLLFFIIFIRRAFFTKPRNSAQRKPKVSPSDIIENKVQYLSHEKCLQVSKHIFYNNLVLHNKLDASVAHKEQSNLENMKYGVLEGWYYMGEYNNSLVGPFGKKSSALKYAQNDVAARETYNKFIS